MTIMLNLGLTFPIPGISIGGHVGGLVTGYVAGELLMSVGPQLPEGSSGSRLASVALLGVALAGGVHHRRLTPRGHPPGGRRRRSPSVPWPAMHPFRRPIAWLQAHPFAADVLLAVVVMAITLPQQWQTPPDTENVVFRDPNAVGFLLSLLASAPLAWRRRAPLTVLALTGFGAAAYELAGFADARSRRSGCSWPSTPSVPTATAGSRAVAAAHRRLGARRSC